MQGGESKKRITKKKLIVQALLRDDRFFSTKEIADVIGYQGKPERCYDYIHSPLKELRNRNYLEYKEVETESPGGRPTIYRIKKDWLTIIQMYLDPDFNSIKVDFWRSGWLQQYIIKMRIHQHFSKEDQENFRKMLQISPRYFEYWLLDSWMTLEDAEIELYSFFDELGLPIPTNEWFEEPRLGMFKKYKDKSFIYYFFFQLCIFCDYPGIYSKEKLPGEVQDLINIATQKIVTLYREAINYQMSLEAMTALIALKDFYRNHSKEDLTALFEMIDDYQEKQKQYGEMEVETPPLLQKLDTRYNTIAEKLGLSNKRAKWRKK